MPRDRLRDLIAAQLVHSDLPIRVSDLILAALEAPAVGRQGAGDANPGDASPGDDLDAGRGTERLTSEAAVYLRAVSVEGFRGIGPWVTLRLRPGPGLTLVTGRNGSGKSSFAEAAEIALTGEGRRWSQRAAVWRGGWRNLHSGGTVRIEITCTVEGIAGPVTVTRSWQDGDGLAEGHGAAATAGGGQLSTSGWEAAFSTHRPFLSYAELSDLLGGRPSAMFDALHAILGLDAVADVARTLTAARGRLTEAARRLWEEHPPLLAALRASGDPRAAQVADALGDPAHLDLDRAWALAAQPPPAPGPAVPPGQAVTRQLQHHARLTALAALRVPASGEVAVLAARLRELAAEEAGLLGTTIGDAARLATLLAAAVDHHEQHSDARADAHADAGAAAERPCPVCGTGQLDEAWSRAATAELALLRERAAPLAAVREGLVRALAEVRLLVAPVPAALITPVSGAPLNPEPGVLATAPAGSCSIPVGAAETAWERWAALRLLTDPVTVAGGLAAAYPPLREAVEELATAAAKALDLADAAWLPLAARVTAWVSAARRAEADVQPLADVRRALEWFRGAAQELRDERIRPFAEQSAGIWSLLRQESNVDLGPVRLTGSANQRRVDLDVTVDGVDSTALGVMSQGELHALGLALFLPRATSEASPFRFLVIDDPVQSMDPAKVDGLARVLAQVAETRQVVVFTHDDRLADAVRRMRLPATVLDLVRREGSRVELRENLDPVERHLADARALVRTASLPRDMAVMLVPAMCRTAVETACNETVRRRRLAAGARHADVEAALTSAHSVTEKAALALFDDARRARLVLRQLDGHAPWAADTFRALRDGVHVGYGGNLSGLIRNTARLADHFRSLA
ncbi:AAA family ATPase [Parafrankia sp. FMc2]|uniref:AAA family ATPase n=1 Tax=Parafrankia sp. FMc2 TaxID=3233196 RepID=UPI0034D6700E